MIFMRIARVVCMRMDPQGLQSMSLHVMQAAWHVQNNICRWLKSDPLTTVIRVSHLCQLAASAQEPQS